MSSLMSVRQLVRQLIIGRTSGCLQRSQRFTGYMMGERGGGSYEGDGKTTLSFMNAGQSPYLLIDSYSTIGFRLSNNQFAFGPIAIFPSVVLQWDIKDIEDVDERSLKLFAILEPRIECLVIGVGDEYKDNRRLNESNRRLRSVLLKMGINCELMSTKHAITTYNFMCADHRVCAGAFIPPTNVPIERYEEVNLDTEFKAKDGKSIFW